MTIDSHFVRHPNHARVQALWDGLPIGDYQPWVDLIEDSVLMWHGPGAGPFAGRGQGLERLGEGAVFFQETFGGTWQQDGECIYACDDFAVSLVHETGTTPDGAVFDNRALWINRFKPDGQIDAIWSVDLDTEHVTEFWDRRRAAELA